MPFPNTTNLAHFEPRSQLIFLNEINSGDIEADFAASRLERIRHSLSTVYHEITHWADTVGTLWGNEYLKQVYAAYDVMPKINVPGSETQFHRFVDLHDSDRRLSFVDYYRTVEDNGRTLKRRLAPPHRRKGHCPDTAYREQEGRKMGTRFMIDALTIGALVGGLILARERAAESFATIRDVAVSVASRTQPVALDRATGTLGIRG